MNHDSGGPPAHGIQRTLWFLTVSLGAVVVGLSAWAYSFNPERDKDPLWFAPVLYHAVQLLLLHGEEKAHGHEIALHSAQVLAVLVVGFAVALTLGKVFERNVRMGCIWFWSTWFDLDGLVLIYDSDNECIT